MKKKTVKKLVLAKETVMNLEQGQWKHVVGGKPPILETDQDCNYSHTTACG
jgi:hypothetical protein